MLKKISTTIIAFSTLLLNISATTTPNYTWALDTTPKILKEMDKIDNIYGPGHRGIDILANSNSNLVAPTDGIIQFSGKVAGKPVITIFDEQNNITITFEPAVTLLEKGTKVKKGEKIGQFNQEYAHCEQKNCLHIGTKIDEQYLDPKKFFQNNIKVRLLPVK